MGKPPYAAGMSADLFSGADPPAPAEGGAEHGFVRSVVAALDVLDCFAHDQELGVSEIARRLGVAKSTAHRLLSSLCSRGLVAKVPESGQYRLGLHLYELGQLVQDRQPVHRIALPVLEQLRLNTGLTVHLSTTDGLDIIFLERLQSLRGIPLLGDRHRRMPLHTTSAGKVLAAFNPSVAGSRERAGFAAMTPQTITDVRTWRTTLADVRRQGYAHSNSENLSGLASVAAPILQASGRATYAVSVAGPADQIEPQIGALARMVMVSARRIGQRLVTR